MTKSAVLLRGRLVDCQSRSRHFRHFLQSNLPAALKQLLQPGTEIRRAAKMGITQDLMQRLEMNFFFLHCSIPFVIKKHIGAVS